MAVETISTGLAPGLPHRLRGVPPGPVRVHCASGYRAGVAAGLLHRDGRSDHDGRDVVHLDDEWTGAADAGVPITTP